MFQWLRNLLSDKPFEARSTEWPRVRAEHLRRQPKCAACEASSVDVHHIRSVSKNPELELMPGNLITLCNDGANRCHFRIGHSFLWTATNPDAIQDAALQAKRIRERR
jgi:5-methylcytosine-specific restriction endonuclease McrA